MEIMRMSKVERPSVGTAYFARDGVKVHLNAVTTDRRFVVMPYMVGDDVDDHEQFGFGPMRIEDDLFDMAPFELADARVRELREEAERLEERNATLEHEAFDAEQRVRARLDKLKKYAGLELLEDFVDGKVTHLVEKTYSIYEINPLRAYKASDEGYEYRDSYRLFSLYGRAGDPLTWKVHRYTDGSGNDRADVWPCTSEEAAKKKRAELVARDLEHAARITDHTRTWMVMRAVQNARAASAAVPAELAAIADAETARQAKEARARLVNQQEETAAAIAKIDATLGGAP